ncbi:MAG: indole-3-glycerol-phosphate synthase [Acidobacteria bacterium]|nr:MAG: indole-3-glycerol-phosphate synthase [Acidobacteriota bacterium]
MPRFKDALTKSGTNIIAEIKYSSPSHGPFACKLSPEDIGKVYRDHGAAAISVLTEEPRFNGKLEYLRKVAEIDDCPPLLRKDFIRTRDQVKEAADHGASAYLLIVRDLSPGLLKDLLLYGEDRNLEPLVEIHDAFELEAAMDQGTRLIGVNNRDLRTFEVKLDTCFQIAKLLEKEKVYTLVAESGIKERSVILELQDAGFSGFLIGSVFMDAKDPGKKLLELRGEA